jgi:integrase/recombinase XerD
MNDLDLRHWQARYREYLEVTRGWSLRTVDTYNAELKPFFAYLERQGLTNLGRLTATHLEGYRLEIYQIRFRGRPLARPTQQVRLSAIKQFVRYLYRENYLLLDIAANFEMPKPGQSLPRIILSEREVVQLIEQPDTKTLEGIRDRALVEVLYGTAVRNSELRLLKMDQVDLERKVLRIDHGKGNKARVVPLGEEAAAWLEEYLVKVRPQLLRRADQKLVFFGSITGEAMSRTWLAVVVQRMAKKAGLEKNVTPHVLRHSLATHMLRRGANVRHLQGLLGHESLDTTQRFTRVEISDLAKVIRRFHPREQAEG